MSSYQQARSDVERLIDHFATLSERNKRSYNEAATRQEFILPLFNALGWDTRNTREVSPEEQVSKGYVDFAFRLGGIPRFFLETKKIPENLDDPRWGRQAINYSWLKGVTWAVLSDFEGLKIFNAEWRETVPARAIFKDLHWQEYLDNFDDLMLLSKDAIWDGAIDELAESVGKKVKKTPVDKLLFEDLATWRHELFRHLRPYNELWSVAQVDEAVQRILSRLIFIRTVEDRLIEEQRLVPLLREWRDRGSRPDLAEHLSRLFRELDGVYDARLFAPHFSETAKCEPTPYVQIIEGLHNLPGGYGFYDFSAIGADVLGTIYEQYLGYVAQDPEAKEVVSKWSKRKRQGIYYTPRFVVKYIVENTLGKMLEERGLEFALNVKVLDPACGSGSFLLGAFDVLDDFIAREQGEVPGEDPKADFARRKHILIHNLYGVDLDDQAVEITRLNLWLRVVNKRGPLPDLPNIRQGNSLIDDAAVVGDVAFDWENEFPEVVEIGGFDVIIGNPPYGAGLTDEEKEYCAAYFQHQDYQMDTYMLFMERCIGLLRPQGYWGMIIPNPWLTNLLTKSIRRFMFSQTLITNIVHYLDKVFPDPTVDVEIVIAAKEQRPGHQVTVTIASEERTLSTHVALQEGWLERDGEPVNIFIGERAETLLSRVREHSGSLKDVCKVRVGMKPYQAGKGKPPQARADVEARIYDATSRLDDTYRRYLRGSDISHYLVNPLEERWISYGEWLAEPRPSANFDAEEKILVRQTGDSPVAALDTEQYLCMNNLHVVVLTDSRYDLRYILGMLNSGLNDWYYEMLNPEKGEALAEVKKANVEKLLVRSIDFSNPADPADVALHNHMVEMVEQMLALKKEHAAAEAMLEDRRHDLAREIEELDAEIDQLVYELYGLSEEEIALVEETTG